jgi:hypothetical protein
MNGDPQAGQKKRWTAAELRQLPFEEREAILAEAAALAEPEYRCNPEWTGYEPLEPQVSQEELRRQEQANEKAYTTAEVLARLENL